jgi:hypothetical protein
MLKDEKIDMGQEEVVNSYPNNYIYRLGDWGSFVHHGGETFNCDACGAFNCYLPYDIRITCNDYYMLQLSAEKRCIDLRNKTVKLIFDKGYNEHRAASLNEKGASDSESGNFTFHKCNICSKGIKFSKEIRDEIYFRCETDYFWEYHFNICEDCYRINSIEEIRNKIPYYHWTEVPKVLDLILTKPFTIEREELEDDEYKNVSYIFQYKDVKDIVDDFLQEKKGILKECIVINQLT